MKIGAVYPQTETTGDPDDIRRFIQGVEAQGYDYVMLFDHVLGASHEGREPKLWGPYTEHDRFLDPFVFFAFAAGLSDKLEFVTGILILPQRQTALVAQQAADVDLFSRERLRLGVAIGWNYVEYQALGQDFRTRGRRLDEQIGLLRQFWSTPLVTFQGEFDRVDRAGINPRPRRQIPVWIGGGSEAAYRRAARLGDGFIFAGARPAWTSGLERVRHLLGEAGRSEASFGCELLAMGFAQQQEVADELKAWRDLGGTHACARSMGLGLGEDMDAHIDYFASLKRRIDAG
jgi:probable F420-dependent oxidoreductase